MKLTLAQLSTLALYAQLGRDGVSLHTHCCFEVSGPLDQDVAEAATLFVGRRHPLLSRTFDVRTGTATAAEPALLLQRHAAEGDVDKHLAELVTSPFRPDAEPALRVAVVQGRPTMLAFVSHAVACDRRSMDVITHDWACAYRAFAGGGRPDLPELTEGYPGEQVDNADDESYWRARLAELVDPSLPSDLTAAETKWDFARHVEAARSAPTGAVADLAARHRLSLFSLLIAAVFTTLGPARLRHAMFSVDGRTRRAQRDAVGPFSGASIVGACDVGTRPLLEVADEVKHGLLDGLGHQRTRLDRVLERLGPQASAGGALGALVVDYRREVDAPRLGDATTTTVHRIDWTAAGVAAPRSLALGLEFTFVEDGPAIRSSLAYNPFRFSGQRAQELVDRAADLLRSAPDGGWAA